MSDNPELVTRGWSAMFVSMSLWFVVCVAVFVRRAWTNFCFVGVVGRFIWFIVSLVTIPSRGIKMAVLRLCVLGVLFVVWIDSCISG